MQPTMETSFVPAPDGEEGKLMLVGGLCWNRNKIPSLPYDANSCYKPAGLSKLSNELFHSFVKDLQLSMRGHWPIYWPILICLFTIFVVVPLFVPVIHLGYYGAACFLALVMLSIAYQNQHKDLQCEIEARINEWQCLFEEEGFQVDCIVDKRLMSPTETYIHIHRSASSGPSELSTTLETSSQLVEEAKYLLLFARLFRHRNITYRIVPLSREPSYWLYAKPPGLQNLSDELFQSLLKDMDIAMRAFVIKKRNTNLLFCVVWLSINFLTAGNEFVTMPLIMLFLVLDQFVSDHLPFLNSHILHKIEEWKPRLEAQGFTVEYRVDQPAWYNWREGYMHIYRHSLSSPDVA